MAIGTSLGAYFDDEFHHQAGINTDPSQDRIDVDPEVDSQSTKPKPELDIMPVSDVVPADDTAAGMAATASEKAADALKSAKGTPPTIDEDTGIKGPILHNIEVGGQRYAMTQDDADAAQSVAMAVSGGGMSVLSKLAPRGSAAELSSALHEGPSPFEQVASAARRARPEDETDRALRMIHEALYPEGTPLEHTSSTFRNLADQARDLRQSIPNPRGESYDELMARLDRQDQARMDAVPANQFKDYGKVQVADRGYGSFLFKAGDSKVLPLGVVERNDGKTLYVNWIGDSSGKAINSFDRGTIKGLFKALADKYPNAEEVAGFRVSGARVNSGKGSDIARMRIPGRGKSNPPRKSIEDLSSEWDASIED